MSEENIFMPYGWTSIPKVFWSDLTSKPFENCILCEQYLLEDGVQYMIEKAIKRYKGVDTISTVFEYAMCLECAEKMRATLSETSKRKIDEYFEKNVDFSARRERLADNLRVEDWLKECVVHQSPSTADGEYQIYGQCDGKDFLFYDLPYMLRGEAVDEMVDLMSNETIDSLRDFMDDLSSGPPELQELLKSGGVKVFV